MPLLKGKENLSKNIEEMRKAGHPEKQSIAAAYHAAGVDSKDWSPEHRELTKDMGPDDWMGVLRYISEEMNEKEHKPLKVGDKWLALTHDKASLYDTEKHAALGILRGLGTYRYALDFSSARTIDQDGRMHVVKTPICMAAVNPYRGDEVPGWDELGLDPYKVYQVFRDPAEIEKAADSSNGIQLMDEHVGVDASNPQREYIAGSIGTDAAWDGERLWNSLSVWDGESIKGIETESKRELSPSYSYDPVVESGTWKGKTFDIRMTNIKFNHVALVEQGRQGPDVYVMDSASQEQEPMPSIWDRVATASTRRLSIFERLARDAEQERDKNGQFASAGEHIAAAAKHETKSTEHRKIGKLRSSSPHTTAEKDHRMAASAHKRAAENFGNKDYSVWAKHAAGSSAAAEKMSAKANQDEPNGPPAKTPQVKW